MLDKECKNILVDEFQTEYNKADNLSNPDEIVKVMNDIFGMENRAEEFLYMVCLTNACRPISFFEVSHGTYNSAPVGIREIMIRALLCGAANIVMIHNHPSGNSDPSREDMIMTERFRKASKLIGIGFSDHIIIGKGEYYSFEVERHLMIKEGFCMKNDSL